MKAYRRFLMSFSSFLIRPCSDRMAGEPEIQSSLALIGYLLATAICISYISKAKLPIIISKVGPDIRQCRIKAGSSGLTRPDIRHPTRYCWIIQQSPIRLALSGRISDIRQEKPDPAQP